MLLSISTNPIDALFSYKDAIRIINEAGFDAYDISLAHLTSGSDNYFADLDYLKKAKELRIYADSLGIICNQAHGPAPTSKGDAETDELIFKTIIKSMEIASVLGAKTIIVHPNQHFTYADNSEKLFELNMQFYNKLIPYCEKFNIKIAVENMWQCIPNTKTITDSTCSQSLEFNRYIDTLNSKWITACADIGHASLVNKDVSRFLKEMGSKRITALHVHDTNLIEDSHTLPFYGLMDYHSITKTLAEIDYKGDFTFEIYKYFKNKPLELIPDYCKHACNIGRYLINEIEKHKNNI
ncbi:MAG: sugar phosphate isomerase/epimerase [Clostridia bacterium]|nr:sugar phosphate isomerase/epimerase [Clostridia bacterium]